MKRLFALILLSLVAVGSGACQESQWPQTRIGLNEPPPGSERTFEWSAVPGASAYQLVISLDRAGTEPAGVTGFSADTRISLSRLAWQPGQPILGRPYFWRVRAYDRPDPQGLLLSTSEPQPVSFEASDFPTLPLVSPSPSTAPAPGTSPTASASPLPTASAQ